MKSHQILILTLALNSNVFAQSTTNGSVAGPIDVSTLPPRPPLSKSASDHLAKMKPIFDGKTLDGWIQSPLFPTAISRGDITDMTSLAKRLTENADPVSRYVSSQLTNTLRDQLAEFSASNTNARAVQSGVARTLNQLVTGPALYDTERFRGIQLRPLTLDLAKKNPSGQELARVNRLLLEDAFPEIAKSMETAWTVKDGAMSSLGAGRGVIYTKDQYTNYRVIFTMRHLGGPPEDHAPCVLIFCATPAEGEKGPDALAGIQFQPPNGGSWDYRPGKNNDGRGLFTRLVRRGFDSKEWHQVELLVNGEKGTARMAVAQPVGSRAIEVLRFNDPTAARKGPIAWQMHNKGLFDEFKDVRIEVDPKDDRLVTVE